MSKKEISKCFANGYSRIRPSHEASTESVPHHYPHTRSCQQWFQIIHTASTTNSPHDTEHCAYKSMFWEEESYIRVQGARAVCIKTSSEARLKYKEGSAKTQSISHIWGHDQGGRREREYMARSPVSTPAYTNGT